MSAYALHVHMLKQKNIVAQIHCVLAKSSLILEIDTYVETRTFNRTDKNSKATDHGYKSLIEKLLHF